MALNSKPINKNEVSTIHDDHNSTFVVDNILKIDMHILYNLEANSDPLMPTHAYK